MNDQLREALDTYPEMHGFPNYEYDECAIVEQAARERLAQLEAGALIITPDEVTVNRIAAATHDAKTSEHTFADCPYELGKTRDLSLAIAVVEALREG